MKGLIVNMKKTEWKGSALLAPVPPALVTCSAETDDGEVINNILTVAWTGIVCSKPAKTYISLRPSRYSYELVRKSGEFVINLTTTELVNAADFCGVRSGRNFDKFEADFIRRRLQRFGLLFLKRVLFHWSAAFLILMSLEVM